MFNFKDIVLAAFPTSKAVQGAEKPREVELLHDNADPDETMDEGAGEEEQAPPIFLLSGMQQEVCSVHSA